MYNKEGKERRELNIDRKNTQNARHSSISISMYAKAEIYIDQTRYTMLPTAEVVKVESSEVYPQKKI
jgi:hypothetical protein